MKYALFDAGGLPLAFYAPEISGAKLLGGKPNPRVPAETVEISDAQWREFVDNAGARRWDGQTVQPYEPPAVAPVAPDSPTLSDWRCGLTLWKRPDGTLRIDEVSAKVAELVATGHPLGRIARERLEYANAVTRSQLEQLAPLFGFSKAEIEESLWRAEQIRLGDLSGKWPVSANEEKA